MDREHTPQKQRQKRNTNLRHSVTSNTSSTSHDQVTKTSFSGPVRAFRGSQRRKSTSTSSPAPSSIMSKTPSMLLRGGPVGSSGILYEPDAPTANRRVTGLQDREKQVETLSNLSGKSSASLTPLSSSLDRRNPRHHVPSSRNPTLVRPSTLSTISPAPKIHPPSTSIKLITSQMQFATDLAIKLGSCLELTNFTVVGVLGFDGVGKSTVLSLLAPMQGPRDSIFSTRSFDSIVLDRHETSGIDLAISMLGGAGHPTVLLDSQPLLSSSILADLMERNETPRFGTLLPDQQVEATSYQLAVFLCAICHYVLIVHDGLAYQLSIHSVLRKLASKVAQCRLPSVSGTSQQHTAQLIYVANKLSESELLYREHELLSAHQLALETAWSTALLRVPSKGSNSCSNETTRLLKGATYILPHRTTDKALEDSETKRKGETSEARQFESTKYTDFDEAAHDLQRFILSLPSSPSFTSNTAAAAAAVGTRPHSLSLREWLSNASRVFEGVRKATCFTAEYTASRENH